MTNIFNGDGEYIKTEWKSGEKISSDKLNKIELGLETITIDGISRYNEIDYRLVALETKNVEELNERLSLIDNAISDNKIDVDLDIYDLNSKISHLEADIGEIASNAESLLNEGLDMIRVANTSLSGFKDDIMELENYTASVGNETFKNKDMINRVDRELRDELTSINATIENYKDGIDQVDKKLDDISEDIPYVEYSRNMPVDFDGEYKYYQGFSNHSKKTYGRFENAAVMSVIANVDDAVPQVLGTDTKGLGTYTNRDSVSLYTENTGSEPVLTISTGMLYTDNSAIVPDTVDMSLIKVGMIIDVGEYVNDDWCVGIIANIVDRELIMEDGFYTVRNDGVEPKKTTPKNNLKARVQWTNKAWVINSNLFVNPGCPAGANMELGVLSRHTNINDVGGIDLINMDKPTHYGIKVRGRDYGFNEGYISSGNTVHFVGKNTDQWTPLLRGVDDKGNIFEMATNGCMSRQAYDIQLLTTSNVIASKAGVVIVNGDNINVTLPPASESWGRIIEIVSIGSNNTLRAATADGIALPEDNFTEVSISAGDGRYLRSLRFVCDGGTTWYLLSDTI